MCEYIIAEDFNMDKYIFDVFSQLFHLIQRLGYAVIRLPGNEIL